MALLWTSHLCSPDVAEDGIIIGGGVKNEEGKRRTGEGRGWGAEN